MQDAEIDSMYLVVSAPGKYMNQLDLGQIYRYARPYSPEQPVIDGLPNFFHATKSETETMAMLERGINVVGKVAGAEGVRIPAILTRSSPHKAGSEDTPWDDIYDFENGHIRYYGDNKDPDQRPEEAPGNKALLEQFSYHSSQDRERRQLSAPIIFFKAVHYEGKPKGHVRFFGFGVIRRVELITQYDRKNQRFFSNFVFDFTILNLKSENQKFDWRWINARRDKEAALKDSQNLAPAAWNRFVSQGPSALHYLRYRYSALFTVHRNAQRPVPGSPEEKTLEEIYDYYTKTQKVRFEALAEKIVAVILSEKGGNYTRGWITSPSSDGGADFIGRLDVGSDFATVQIIVLGQAKCESLSSATGGNHIARTVARLKRGWIGAYVTTSFFSEAVQREIIEDDYPILLVHGKKLVEVVQQIIYAEGHKNIRELLIKTDQEYEQRVQDRSPEEILHDFSTPTIQDGSLEDKDNPV